jgi:hypothetical protein
MTMGYQFLQMRCPTCGTKLSFLDLTWSERLFWFCLLTIAMNQGARLFDFLYEWIYFGWMNP